MSKMDRKLHIACSPLTGNIYCGRVLKDGLTWGDGKIDVTSEVLGAIIEKVGAGNSITVRANGVPAYEIEVRKISGLKP